MLARPLLFGIAAAGIALASVTAAHAQPTPPRDRPQPQLTGRAIVKGHVVDAQTRSAVPRARVSLFGPPGNRPPTLTDDEGRFEFKDLPAGTFYISVEKAGYAVGRYPEPGRTIRGGSRPIVVTDRQPVSNVSVPLYRGGAITGRVIDAHGDPVEFVQLQVLRVPAFGRGLPQNRGSAMTNDLGEFRVAKLEPGAYLLRAAPQNVRPEDGSEMRPLPTYYPGVASLDLAQPIAVERAQTVTGLEIMLGEGTTSIVTGTVVDAKGQPVSGGSLEIRPVTTEIREFGMSSFGGSVRPDGTFRLNLAPGEYELQARVMPPGVMGSSRAGDEQVGVAHVSVAGVPISDLTIQLAPPAVMSGRIVFDGTSPPPPDVQQLRIALGSRSSGSTCRAGRSEVAADWTFRIEGTTGSCTIMPVGSSRWTMKRVMYRDVDVLDQQITFLPGQVWRGVEVVFTDRRTELTVDVTDDHGLQTREYVAIVFPHDKTKWTEYSRHLRTYVPPPPRPVVATNGPATVVAPMPERPDALIGLPPGEYYAVAVDDLPADAARDPAVLESLVSAATRVTVTDATPVRLSLRRRAFQTP